MTRISLRSSGIPTPRPSWTCGGAIAWTISSGRCCAAAWWAAQSRASWLCAVTSYPTTTAPWASFVGIPPRSRTPGPHGGSDRPHPPGPSTPPRRPTCTLAASSRACWRTERTVRGATTDGSAGEGRRGSGVGEAGGGEEGDRVTGGAVEGEVGQDLADDRGELEAVAGEAGGDGHLRRARGAGRSRSAGRACWCTCRPRRAGAARPAPAAGSSRCSAQPGHLVVVDLPVEGVGVGLRRRPPSEERHLHAPRPGRRRREAVELQPSASLPDLDRVRPGLNGSMPPAGVEPVHHCRSTVSGRPGRPAAPAPTRRRQMTSRPAS